MKLIREYYGYALFTIAIILALNEFYSSHVTAEELVVVSLCALSGYGGLCFGKFLMRYQAKRGEKEAPQIPVSASPEVADTTPEGRAALWEVRSTHASLECDMTRLYPSGFVSFHDPRLKIALAKHMAAVNVFLLYAGLKAEHDMYYLQLKQLYNTGHRADFSCQELSGLPKLPTADQFLRRGDDPYVLN